MSKKCNIMNNEMLGIFLFLTIAINVHKLHNWTNLLNTYLKLNIYVK